ncbi:hypothetical protein QWZ08_26960 [Ferruginibacter paludis]|uniref:hypothetical protein n=1 Tax=Ferruginibacter paludis TaxID=1310417 RepID=UPI0025B486B9|nr:hypothetical protein [Ferruginibacter paludis]MDN3659315.1 hypothetical protein [Ferruginibacter paludis]
MLFLTSCQNYYKAIQVHLVPPANKSSVIDSLRLSEKYFILRSGSDAFSMVNPVLNADRKTMVCILDSVPFYHQLQLVKGADRSKKYKKSDPLNSMVLNEVHFFTPQDNAAAFGVYTLRLDRIQKIEIIENDKNRTTGSHILGGVLFTIGILAISSAIFASSFNF